MIRAITLDLDDTLWPIAPVMLKAEQALDAWLAEHAPEVARDYPVERMRALRERIAHEHPHLAHDFTAMRKLCLTEAFEPHGHGADAVERAFEHFFAARHCVELYPEAAAALERLAARWPLATLSNGNADVHRIGLGHHFRCCVCARTSGVAKPDPRIFTRAAELLGVPVQQIAHVGDDPELDVLGAHAAGMVTVWLDRHDAGWRWPVRPDITIRGLDELEAALDAYIAGREDAA